MAKRLAILSLAVSAVGLLLLSGTVSAQVQEKVLYSFCSAAGCTDGASPRGVLTFDAEGNLYGTTQGGGSNCQAVGGCGTVFELNPTNGGSWFETVLYNFCVNSTRNCPDGAAPAAGLVFDRIGNLYGTTQTGGSFGVGVVYELSPPVDGGGWTETVVWSFGAAGDGVYPLSRLLIDARGNLYGTTQTGGPYGGGVIYQLLPPSSGGQWTENILYTFGPTGYNGYNLRAGLVADVKGNLYGTTYEGGAQDSSGLGVIYKLSPNTQLPWTETVLFRFTKRSGANPVSTLNFDKLGNLYGTTTVDAAGFGSIFRLTPQNKFSAISFGGTPDAEFPWAGVFIKGNLVIGTTQGGGSQGLGALYQVQGGKETALYSFCSLANCADGEAPSAGVISRGGNLYGTTTEGGTGAAGGGVVYEITMPQQDRAPSAAKKKIPAQRPSR